MHHSGITGWRWVRTSWLVTVCAIGFNLPAVYGQKDMGAGYCSKHGNYTGASCPRCAASANPGSNSASAQNQLVLQAAGQLGSVLGQMLRGDPARDARLAAETQERALAAQRAAEAAAAEAARKKQEAFDRLRGSLKLDNFDGDRDGGLLLKGIDVGSESSMALKSGGAGNELGLKLEDADPGPPVNPAQPKNGDGGSTVPHTDPMVVDLRKAPAALTHATGGNPALQPGLGEVQTQATPAPVSPPEPEPEPAAEPEPATPSMPAPAPAIGSAAVDTAARKTISILDRAVSSALESMKSSQSGQSVAIDSELSEIKAMLAIPPSGKPNDHTVRTIAFGHQASAKSGNKQMVGNILVVRDEATGEVRIDVTQEQEGKAPRQNIIRIDRFGNILEQESR